VALKGKTKGKAKDGEKKEYDNTNRGVLFPNDKEGNENRPDYTGKINVDGVDKRIAAWVSSNDRVGDYLRIVASDFEEKSE
jgi:hypothetical protein